MRWIVPSHGQSAVVSMSSAITVRLLLFTGSAIAHGDEDHSAPDSSVAGQADSTVLLRSFKRTLDSVYEEIAGAYARVEPMLRKSCYDCHSDQTEYPWYYRLPIVKGMIDADITEARKHLDMSDGFPFGGHASQLEQLRAIREEVEEGEMPLWSYRLMHRGTKIEGPRQDTLFRWIDSSATALEQCYRAHGVPIPTETAESHED